MEGARAATSDDLPALAGLARTAVAELALLRGGEVWRAQVGRREPIAEGLAAQLARPVEEGAVVVGTVDDVVVGYGVSSVEVLADGERLSVISDLYAAPEARGIGVGEAMMDLLVAHARSLDAIGIDALALPGDRATKNFFETFGLKARAIVVHRSLREPEAGDA